MPDKARIAMETACRSIPVNYVDCTLPTVQYDSGDPLNTSSRQIALLLVLQRADTLDRCPLVAIVVEITASVAIAAVHEFPLAFYMDIGVSVVVGVGALGECLFQQQWTHDKDACRHRVSLICSFGKSCTMHGNAPHKQSQSEG